MSESNRSPAAELIHGLLSGLRDGSLNPSEGREVLLACADLIDALSERHAEKWWARLVLASAAAAVRQSAEALADLPETD